MFNTRVKSGGHVVVHDGRVIVTEVPKHSDDYQGCEDAVDVAQFLANALTVYIATPKGQQEWESVRESCSLKKLEPS